MKNLIFATAIVMLCIVGCTGKKVVETDVESSEVAFKVSDARTADTLVSDITYIGLPPIDGALPGSVDKLSFSDDKIIIADYRYGKIFVYDSNGVPQFVINHRGAGPGEYAELRCMAADADNIYVVDNSRRQLLTYSVQDGSFIRSVGMPVVADDIETLENGDVIFASVLERGAKPAVDQEAARLFVADKDMNIKNAYYAYEEGEYEPIGQKYYLTRNGDDIVFSTVMFDGMTVIDRKNPDSHRQLKFIFDNGLNGKVDVPLEEIQDYQHLVLPPFVCKDYLSVTYANGNHEIEYGVWDMKAGELLKNPLSDIHHAVMPIIGVNADRMYGYVESMEGYTPAVEYGFVKASDEVEKILADGGSALVVYQMK